jgi:hypothetical protein
MMSRYLSFASVLFLFFIISCQKEKSYEQGKPSHGSLQDSVGDCLSKSVVGTYTATKKLTDSNYIDVDVNVAQPGHYAVYTDTVNGYYFSATGTFTKSGLNTVRMKGSGTPGLAGIDDFIIFYDSTFCDVSVTVGDNSGTPGTPNTDHQPLTANSYWTYNDAYSTTATDTIKRVNDNTTSHNGNNYRVITEYDNSGSPQWEYHLRKTGNDYFEYTTVDDYSVMSFDTAVEGDILFLKEGLSTNATWLSSEYSGVVNSVPTKLRYSFTCTDANASITVNGKTFTNVYKITWKSQISSNGGAYTDEGLTWVSYYAQGIGLVDMKGTLGANSIEYKIRYYKVF